MIAVSPRYTLLPNIRVLPTSAARRSFIMVYAANANPHIQEVYLDRSRSKQVITMRVVGPLGRYTAIVFSVLTETFSVVEIRAHDKLVVVQ